MFLIPAACGRGGPAMPGFRIPNPPGGFIPPGPPAILSLSPSSVLFRRTSTLTSSIPSDSSSLLTSCSMPPVRSPPGEGGHHTRGRSASVRDDVLRRCVLLDQFGQVIDVHVLRLIHSGASGDSEHLQHCSGLEGDQRPLLHFSSGSALSSRTIPRSSGSRTLT